MCTRTGDESYHDAVKILLEPFVPCKAIVQAKLFSIEAGQTRQGDGFHHPRELVGLSDFSD